jgi:hypothetical protein
VLQGCDEERNVIVGNVKFHHAFTPAFQAACPPVCFSNAAWRPVPDVASAWAQRFSAPRRCGGQANEDEGPDCAGQVFDEIKSAVAIHLLLRAAAVVTEACICELH